MLESQKALISFSSVRRAFGSSSRTCISGNLSQSWNCKPLLYLLCHLYTLKAKSGRQARQISRTAQSADQGAYCSEVFDQLVCLLQTEAKGWLHLDDGVVWSISADEDRAGFQAFPDVAGSCWSMPLRQAILYDVKSNHHASAPYVSNHLEVLYIKRSLYTQPSI